MPSRTVAAMETVLCLLLLVAGTTLRGVEGNNIMKQGGRLELNEHIVCPRSGTSRTNTKVNGSDPVRRYTEISGLALSPTQTAPESGRPIMYVVNDGSDEYEGRVGVYDSGTGQRLLTISISNTTLPSSYDWEALAIGSCGYMEEDAVAGVDTSEWSCLYIGDVGDNVARNTKGRRSDRTANDPYRLIKIREPDITQLLLQSRSGRDGPAVPIPDKDVSTLILDYGHASSPTEFADCEAIFLDPTGWGFGGAVGDLYLITKWNSANVSNTRLFKVPTTAWSYNHNPYSSAANRDEDGASTKQQQQQQQHLVYSPRAVGFNSPSDELLSWTWTGADMTRDGTVISLSTYEDTSIYLRCPGSTVAEALTGKAHYCHYFDNPASGQVETTAWTADGRQHLEIPEGNRARMGWTTMIYDEYDEDDFDPLLVAELATIPVDVNGSNITLPPVPPPPTFCPAMEWVIIKGKSTLCRTRNDHVAKPDDWCHYATNMVPVIYLDLDSDLTITVNKKDGHEGLESSGKAAAGKSVSAAWQPAFLVVKILLIGAMLGNWMS